MKSATDLLINLCAYDPLSKNCATWEKTFRNFIKKKKKKYVIIKAPWKEQCTTRQEWLTRVIYNSTQIPNTKMKTTIKHWIFSDNVSHEHKNQENSGDLCIIHLLLHAVKEEPLVVLVEHFQAHFWSLSHCDGFYDDVPANSTFISV